jgi:hypothetical protein
MLSLHRSTSYSTSALNIAQNSDLLNCQLNPALLVPIRFQVLRLFWESRYTAAARTIQKTQFYCKKHCVT